MRIHILTLLTIADHCTISEVLYIERYSLFIGQHKIDVLYNVLITNASINISKRTEKKKHSSGSTLAALSDQ